MNNITPRDQQKALEAETVLGQLLAGIPDREPFREVRARLVEAEALMTAITEGVEPDDPDSPAFGHSAEDRRSYETENEEGR